MKYKQLQDGETIEIDIAQKELFYQACCDCGLVHRIGFAIEESGKLGIAFERDEAETKKLRKQKTYKKLIANLQEK